MVAWEEREGREKKIVGLHCGRPRLVPKKKFPKNDTVVITSNLAIRA